jgi:iron-sulfur cluster repair protein YtfE (RIC family)
MTTSFDDATVAFAQHEHVDLRPGLDRLHDVALRAAHLPIPELSQAVHESLGWATRVLAPHAAWEDAWLYPGIDQREATGWATRTMRFEHHQIRRLVDALRVQRAALLDHEGVHDPAAVTAALVALETLIRAHIEREERFLIPLLDEAAPH